MVSKMTTEVIKLLTIQDIQDMTDELELSNRWSLGILPTEYIHWCSTSENTRWEDWLEDFYIEWLKLNFNFKGMITLFNFETATSDRSWNDHYAFIHDREFYIFNDYFFWTYESIFSSYDNVILHGLNHD